MSSRFIHIVSLWQKYLHNNTFKKSVYNAKLRVNSPLLICIHFTGTFRWQYNYSKFCLSSVIFIWITFLTYNLLHSWLFFNESIFLLNSFFNWYIKIVHINKVPYDVLMYPLWDKIKYLYLLKIHHFFMAKNIQNSFS
jgi:hypothetical protein